MIKPFSEDLLKDRSVSVLYDFEADSEVLLITFSGVGIGIGVPFFEFLKALTPFNIRKIVVRDVHKSWYHAGLEGVSNDIDGSIPALKELIEKSGAKSVIVLGNSMGGYAALLYGALLGVDEVLAFAPTTFADNWNRIKNFDYRRMYKYLRQSPVKSPKYYDLAKVPGMDHPDIHIFFDNKFRTDRAHAEHLARHHKNVSLYRYEGGRHGVIKVIKKMGDLDKIIGDAVTRAEQRIQQKEIS